MKVQALSEKAGVEAPKPASGGPVSWGKKETEDVKPAAAPSAPPVPSNPGTPAPPTPQSSGPNFNVSSYNPASGQPDPRDAEYWANLAKIQATAQQEHAGGLLEQSTADTSYGRQLSEAGEQRRRGIRNTAENLIGTGLLRSGSHNRKQTEGTIDYTSQLAGWGEQKSSSDARRKAQMDAILQNLGMDELGLYTESTGRYADKQAEAAARQEALNQQVFENQMRQMEYQASLGGGGGGGGSFSGGTYGFSSGPKPKKRK